MINVVSSIFAADFINDDDDDVTKLYIINNF